MKIPSLDRYQSILVIVILSALLYILFLGNNSLVSRCDVQNKIDATVTEINRIKEENRILSEEINRLKNDEEYVASLAHKLGYIKPNEKVYRFITFVSNDGSVIIPERSPFLEFLGKNTRILIIIGSTLLLIGGVIAIRLFTRSRKKKRPENRRPSFF